MICLQTKNDQQTNSNTNRVFRILKQKKRKAWFQKEKGKERKAVM